MIVNYIVKAGASVRKNSWKIGIFIKQVFLIKSWIANFRGTAVSLMISRQTTSTSNKYVTIRRVEERCENFVIVNRFTGLEDLNEFVCKLKSVLCFFK